MAMEEVSACGSPVLKTTLNQVLSKYILKPLLSRILSYLSRVGDLPGSSVLLPQILFQEETENASSWGRKAKGPAKMRVWHCKLGIPWFSLFRLEPSERTQTHLCVSALFMQLPFSQSLWAPAPTSKASPELPLINPSQLQSLPYQAWCWQKRAE